MRLGIAQGLHEAIIRTPRRRIYVHNCCVVVQRAESELSRKTAGHKPLLERPETRVSVAVAGDTRLYTSGIPYDSAVVGSPVQDIDCGGVGVVSRVRDDHPHIGQ